MLLVSFKRLIVVSIVFFASHTCIYAELPDDYVEQVEKKYSAGDIDSAIKDMEKAIGIAESKDDKDFYKFMLGTWLIPLAEQYYNKGNYEKALPYLKKLTEISPEDQGILKMYNDAKISVEAVKKVEEEKKVEEKKEVKLESLISLMESYMKKQEKLLQSQKEKLSKELLGRSETEKNALLDEFNKRENLYKLVLTRTESQIRDLQTEFNKRSKELKQTYGVVTAIVLVTIFIFVFVFIILSRHYAFRREKSFKQEVVKIKEEGIIQASYAKIIDKIEKEIPRLRFVQEPKVEKRYNQREFEKLVASGDVETRIRVLESIKSEISEDFSLSKEFGVRLVNPFLNDSDPRVKACAVDVLHECSPHEATKLLNVMFSDRDPRVRIEVLNVVKDWFPPSSVKILLELEKKEEDENVRRVIIHLLSDFMRNKKRFLPGGLQGRIKELIAVIQKKGKWVIE